MPEYKELWLTERARRNQEWEIAMWHNGYMRHLIRAISRHLKENAYRYDGLHPEFVKWIQEIEAQGQKTYDDWVYKRVADKPLPPPPEIPGEFVK